MEVRARTRAAASHEAVSAAEQTLPPPVRPHRQSAPAIQDIRTVLTDYMYSFKRYFPFYLHFLSLSELIFHFLEVLLSENRERVSKKGVVSPCLFYTDSKF